MGGSADPLISSADLLGGSADPWVGSLKVAPPGPLDGSGPGSDGRPGGSSDPWAALPR